MSIANENNNKTERPPQSPLAVMTQAQVARALGVSRSCVSGVEKRALRKLRDRLGPRIDGGEMEVAT